MNEEEPAFSVSAIQDAKIELKTFRCKIVSVTKLSSIIIKRDVRIKYITIDNFKCQCFSLIMVKIK